MNIQGRTVSDDLYRTAQAVAYFRVWGLAPDEQWRWKKDQAAPPAQRERTASGDIVPTLDDLADAEADRTKTNRSFEGA